MKYELRERLKHVCSPEKREFLKALGAHHVLDSRSNVFAEEVMELTNGKGADIILNSLAGDAIPLSISVWQRWSEVHAAGSSPRFSHSAREKAVSSEAGDPLNKGDSFRNAFIVAESAERQHLVESYLIEQIALTLETSSAKLDKSKMLTNLGLDSLMAVELSNRIEKDLGVSFPTVKLMGDSSIFQLAKELVEQLASTRTIVEGEL